MTKEELAKENAELLDRLVSVSIALCNVLKCVKAKDGEIYVKRQPTEEELRTWEGMY